LRQRRLARVDAWILSVLGEQWQADRDPGRDHIAVERIAMLIGEIDTEVGALLGSRGGDIGLGAATHRIGLEQIGVAVERSTKLRGIEIGVGRLANRLRIRLTRPAREFGAGACNLGGERIVAVFERSDALLDRDRLREPARARCDAALRRPDQRP
jgi:hypothetical protein